MDGLVRPAGALWWPSSRHPTTCIESGVDIPTISRWLGHSDGGALAMRVYGHLRQEHSFAMIRRVDFGSEPVLQTAQAGA